MLSSEFVLSGFERWCFTKVAWFINFGWLYYDGAIEMEFLKLSGFVRLGQIHLLFSKKNEIL